MAKSTALVIVILAIIAALITGIQIGRKADSGSLLVQNPTSTPEAVLPSFSPIPTTQTLSHEDCGVRLDHPSDYQINESSVSAILTNNTTGDRISLACSSEIPLPPLPPEKIEEATVAGQNATIYHDASAQNGSPVDVVIFDHPENDLTIALLGFGDVFQKVLSSLQILPQP